MYDGMGRIDVDLNIFISSCVIVGICFMLLVFVLLVEVYLKVLWYVMY